MMQAAMLGGNSSARAGRSQGVVSRRAARARCSSGFEGDARKKVERRAVLAAPGLAALAEAAYPGRAGAAIKPTNPPITGYDDSIAAAKVGPLGGAVGVKDYEKFKPVIYGFIDGIKSGECPPWAKNATRGFLLKEVGGNRAMLTILIPEADMKDGLAFFINEGPKANPLWEEANATWRDASVPISATASTAFLVRGTENAYKSAKGKYFGQYNLGWNGNVKDFIPLFTSPEADEFHNSVGIDYSVAHKIDTKDPGNTYKTKAKSAIEVFHCFDSLDGAKELEKVFVPDSPFFVNEPRYVGPYYSVIWKVEDDIVFKA